MRPWIIAIAAAVGATGLSILFVLGLLAAIRIVERRRRVHYDDYGLWGDPRYPQITGDYRTGVSIEHKREAAADEPVGDVVTLPDNWPGRARHG